MSSTEKEKALKKYYCVEFGEKNKITVQFDACVWLNYELIAG